MQFGVQNSGFNAPVFLGELRDLKTLYDNLGDWFIPNRPLSVITEHFRGLRDGKNLKTYEVLRRIAQGNLFVNFAVKPFINDLQRMMEVHAHVLKQMDRLRSPKPTTVKNSYVEIANVDTTSNLASPPNNYHGYTTMSVAKRTTTAWARVQYNWGSSFKQPTLGVWADALGFNRPIEVLWELTPWSFLVDYFLDVGSFLSQFNGNFVEVPYTVLQDGWSVKTERACTCTLYVDNGQYALLWRNLKQSTIEGKLSTTTYVRTPGPLDYSSFGIPQLQTPNLRQVGNIGSIVTLFLLGRS
jgi:hypothetical protein